MDGEKGEKRILVQQSSLKKKLCKERDEKKIALFGTECQGGLA